MTQTKGTRSTLPKLPGTLFIRYEDPELPEDDDDQFLMEFRHIYDAAQQGVKHLVGIYVLTEVREVELQITETLVDQPAKTK